jgi:hypothetical protein
MVIWLVGIVLLRFTPQHFMLIVGFNFLNIAMGIAPDDATTVWPTLAETGLGKIAAMSLALLIMAYVGAIIMRIVRNALTIPYFSLVELIQAFREAQRANVTSTFQRELLHSRNVWFNSAGFFPPLIAPLFATSGEALTEYLLFAQPLLLYAFSRLWLPKGQRVGFFLALFFHGLPLAIFFAGKTVQPVISLESLLMGLWLAIIGIITAEFVRRIA